MNKMLTERQMSRDQLFHAKGEKAYENLSKHMKRVGIMEESTRMRNLMVLSLWREGWKTSD